MPTSTLNIVRLLQVRISDHRVNQILIILCSDDPLAISNSAVYHHHIPTRDAGTL